jgi:hypothetical protein
MPAPVTSGFVMKLAFSSVGHPTALPHVLSFPKLHFCAGFCFHTAAFVFNFVYTACPQWWIQRLEYAEGYCKFITKLMAIL